MSETKFPAFCVASPGAAAMDQVTSQKATIGELREKIEPLLGYAGCSIQHVKTTEWYRVTGFFYLESDMSIWFTYETRHRAPVAFARPVGELFDGRFAIGSSP